MRSSKLAAWVSLMFGWAVLTGSAGATSIVPSTRILDSTQYEIADQCPPPTAVLYHEAVEQVSQGVEDGSIQDTRLLDYLLANKDLLSSSDKALAEVMFPVDVSLAPVDDLATLFGKAGGTVNGTRWSFKNVFGWEVGSGQLQISWNNNANACKSVISGVTWTGSIPIGNCSAEQVGDKFTRSCPRTAACSNPTRECGNFQIVCSQSLLFCRLNSFRTALETICAPCP